MMNSVVANALLNVLGKAQCQIRSKPYCILSALLTQEHPELLHGGSERKMCGGNEEIFLQRYRWKQPCQ